MAGRNNKANKEAILESYGRSHNMKAVCRELGYAYTTVVQVVYQSRGLCQCGNPIDARSIRFCTKCLEMQRRTKARSRKLFHDDGRCTFCGGQRDIGTSLLCKPCRDKRKSISERYRATHHRAIRGRQFGGLWLLVMERDDWVCKVCGAPAKDVHHIDEVPNHHTLDNLLAMCRSCHLTLTRLNSQPNLDALLPLVRPKLTV